VEHEPRELEVGVADERRQERVVEPAERRVRRDAADVDVEALGLESRRLGTRLGLAEVAAVVDAAGDREAPLART
jgi:hypothetical protein